MKLQLKLALLIILTLGVFTFNACGDDGGSDTGDNGDDLIDVVFTSVTQDDGVSGTTTTTTLTLEFSEDPTTLTADNITIDGATKGALSGTGTTRSIGITDITVANGAEITVSVTSPTDYSISGSPKSVEVYHRIAIGETYLGGKIAYIFQLGDTGYVAGELHGIIAAAADQSAGIPWAISTYQSINVPDGTGTAIGTGSSNTDNIIDQNGAGTSYAAGLARACNDGGYDDWYLPSRYEMNRLYENRSLIGGFSTTTAVYWCSTEDRYDRGWSHVFPADSQGYAAKSASCRVRAIRNF